MAKKAYVYNGTAWEDLASSITDMSNYPNMTTTPISGFRNVLINGDFKVWQRGTSGSHSGGGVYADMWREYTDTGSGTQSRDTTVGVAGVTTQSYKFTVGGSATNWSLWQIIESANCAHLAGQTVTLSFYAQASAARSINVGFASSTTTDAVWTGSWTAFGTTPIAVTTTMTRYTVTATIPANMRTLYVSFNNGSTNFPSGFTINVTGVQLERGTIATPFEQRPIGTELALCQRYFCKSFPIDVAPANGLGTTAATGGNNLMTFAPTLGNSYSPWKTFPVVMRRTPDVTIYNVNATANTWECYSSAGSIGNLGPNVNASVNGFTAFIAGNGTVTVANGAWAASAEL